MDVTRCFFGGCKAFQNHCVALDLVFALNCMQCQRNSELRSHDISPALPNTSKVNGAICLGVSGWCDERARPWAMLSNSFLLNNLL